MASVYTKSGDPTEQIGLPLLVLFNWGVDPATVYFD